MITVKTVRMCIVCIYYGVGALGMMVLSIVSFFRCDDPLPFINELYNAYIYTMSFAHNWDFLLWGFS